MMHLSGVLVLLLVLLAGWRIYSRYRTLSRKQRFSAKRSWLSLSVLSLLFIMLAWLSLREDAAAGALLAGGILGICLGVLGLRLTLFETSEDGLLYTPNRYLGTALLLVVVVRIAYRLVRIFLGDLPSPDGDISMQPSSFAVMGVIICYFAVYSAGLLRRHHAGRERSAHSA